MTNVKTKNLPTVTTPNGATDYVVVDAIVNSVPTTAKVLINNLGIGVLRMVSVTLDMNLPVGEIYSIDVNPTNGGTGYNLNDVLTISTGNADATVLVTGVNAGVVTNLTLGVRGTGYTVGAGQATAGGGNNDCTVDILSLSSYDQLITLTGGTSFALVDILLTNSSTDLNTALNGQFHSAINRGGYKFAATDGYVFGAYTDAISCMILPTNLVSISSQSFYWWDGRTQLQSNGSLYFSTGTPQGAVATCECRVYYYVLA